MRRPTAALVAIVLLACTPWAAGADVAAAPPQAPSPAVPTEAEHAGVIEVLVTRADGGPAGFVDVTVRGERGFEEVQLADEAGRALFARVPAGRYEVEVFSEGLVFERAVDVEVVAGATKAIGLREVATGAQEAVVVDARAADVVDIVETHASSTISGNVITKIPTENRRVQDFVFLHPGVVRSGSKERRKKRGEPDAHAVSIAGGSSARTGYQVDGPVGRLDVPAAAIRSYALITRGFAAEHGEQSTGIAEVLGGVVRQPVGPTPASPVDASADVAHEPVAGDRYAPVKDLDFASSKLEPLATLSIDVDTASYANVRRMLREGTIPPADAVRIEEMINAFDYGDPEPSGDEPFTVRTELADCPWDPEHRLLRVGLQARRLTADQRPPLHLVFLVDVSGSMSSPDKLPLVQHGLRALARSLRPDDGVAMVVYAGAAGLVLPPTPGSAAGDIVAAIDRLSAGGSTAGEQGLRLAYATARGMGSPGDVRRVVLATDGDFNVGVTGTAELVQLVEQEKAAGIHLSVLGVGRGNLDDAMMERIADHGDGNYSYFDTPAEAERVLVEQASGTLVTIAKDVKVQVEWNPARVAWHRLIGYSNRLLSATDFDDDAKDAGEMGAGHAVTVLFEIAPGPAEDLDLASPSEPLRYQTVPSLTEMARRDELAVVRTRWKEPDAERSQRGQAVVRDAHVPFAAASADLRFAAAVAELGMLLRGTAPASITSEVVASHARGAEMGDPRRAEIAQLARRWGALVGEVASGQ